ncbi:nucleoside 2-deoxyribosyltransferase [Acidisoma silvae]|uniref:Nucleoside 2-deoxyribosyltransferase n=2 Tax=Acidisoma silvae TaxID=2802396 RepID=A0A963YR07_9PROT|nr:nucleoside 2-deoxyribosyltransferase [Acidisoma silvae]
MITAYLAGPDVFLPNAVAHAARKVDICAAYGIRGLPPLNEDIAALAAMTDAAAGIAIFAKDLEMMAAADIIIANLTPFRGTSADSGTLIEVGWFLGRGRPIFGYSNSAVSFQERSRAFLKHNADPLPDVTVEGFGLPDNLMIPGAVQSDGRPAMVLPEDGRDRAFDALDIFERCVAQAAKYFRLIP